MASQATTIPDELLTEILLRLPDPADLARVSATCPIFRRLATDRSFLRRYRKLHPPTFLGFVDEDKAFHPALPPHPSAPAARAVALAADFSFSFLPTPARSWVIQEIRDGRVLLLDCDPYGMGRRVFTELVVCDPLYRQYTLLPSVPDDLAASVEDQPAPMRWCEPVFVPPGEEEDETLAEETAFRVMWMAEYETKFAVFDFSTSTGQWRAVSSKCWVDLFPTAVMSKVQPGCVICDERIYAYGCFYWVTDYWWEKMLKLDIRKMEFSITDFPPGGWRSRRTVIVEAGEGRHGMIFTENWTGYNKYTSDLGYTIRQNNGQDSWQMEKPITIPSGYLYDIVGQTEKHLILEMTKETYQTKDFEYFSLDVNTLHMERVCVAEYGIDRPRRYTNFPPSLLSSPTVCSGIHKGATERMLQQGADVPQGEARSYHGQNTADAIAGGQADLLGITDGSEVGQEKTWKSSFVT